MGDRGPALASLANHRVLHELLDAETIEIAALSGTTPGATNAVLYADGWLSRPDAPGRGAKDALAGFWHLNAIASTALTGGLNANPGSTTGFTSRPTSRIVKAIIPRHE